MTATDTLERVAPPTAETLEQALIGADLSKLTSAQRLALYNSVCQSLGLNPMTKPFAFIQLNGKLTLYALRDCTDQLRKIHNVSIEILERQKLDDLYVVRTRATLPSGRSDEAIGAVSLKGQAGENLANALMKGETKAKRRVTLSICGLGWLDETEVNGLQQPAFRGTTLRDLKADEATAALPSGPVTIAGETVDTGTGEVLDAVPPVEELPADHYRIKRAWIDKSGTKNNRPWTLYAVETVTGDKFSTFDARIYETAQTCVEDGTPVEIVTETKRFGKEIVTFMPTRAREPEPVEDGEELPF